MHFGDAQAAQEASDISSGKVKASKTQTVESANAAYEEAAKAANLAVSRAQEAARETGDYTAGVWEKVRPTF